MVRPGLAITAITQGRRVVGEGRGAEEWTLPGAVTLVGRTVGTADTVINEGLMVSGGAMWRVRRSFPASAVRQPSGPPAGRDRNR